MIGCLVGDLVERRPESTMMLKKNGIERGVLFRVLRRRPFITFPAPVPFGCARGRE